jgi:hypothetical protein
MSLTLEPVPPSQTNTWPGEQLGPAVDGRERPEVLLQAAMSEQTTITVVRFNIPDLYRMLLLIHAKMILPDRFLKWQKSYSRHHVVV